MKTFEHPASVTALAYARDGASIFSADTGETVRAWDVATGEHVAVHQNGVDVSWLIQDLEISPNGQWLLIGCLVCRIGPIPDSNRRVVYSDQKTFGRIRLASGWSARRLDGGPGAVFSPNSRLIAGGNGTDSIRLWRIASGETMGYWQHGQKLSRPTFSPDGKTLASVFSDGVRDTGLVLWDVKTLARRLAERVHYDAIHIDSIPLYSPDGRWLVVASGDIVHLHNARSRVLAWEGALRSPSVKHIDTIAFSPDSKHLLTGGKDDPNVRLWDVRARHVIAQWDWQIGAVNQVAFAPDGMTAAAAGGKGQLVVWDLDL
jgi:WD40 repeat protein